MDFMNRGSQTAQNSAHQEGGAGTGRKSKVKGIQLGKVGYVAFVSAIAILLIGVILLGFTKSSSGEGQYVDKNKYQAVFLNGGQVYFGKVSDLNKQFLRISDIYYLRVNQQVQPNQSNNNAQNDISLVKLGCELHGPQDSMVVNRDQVIFWENLKDDGQVAKAVAEYVKQNPNGQKCQTNSGSANTTTDNNAAANNSAANTTNSTNKTNTTNTTR